MTAVAAITPLIFWYIPKFVIFVIHEVKQSKAIAWALDDFGEARSLQLLDTISALGDAPPLGCILHKTGPDNETGNYVIRLPGKLPEFPWAGHTLVARFTGWETEIPVEFSLDPHATPLPLRNPVVFWPPRVTGNRKKPNHVFSSREYIKRSVEVKAAVTAAFPEEPVEFLDALRRKYGLLDYTVRIGLSPEWVQGHRLHKCPECSKPMRLIAQIPGLEIHDKLGEGVFYLFGCTMHPEKTEAAQDWF